MQDGARKTLVLLGLNRRELLADVGNETPMLAEVVFIDFDTGEEFLLAVTAEQADAVRAFFSVPEGTNAAGDTWRQSTSQPVPAMVEPAHVVPQPAVQTYAQVGLPRGGI